MGAGHRRQDLAGTAAELAGKAEDLVKECKSLHEKVNKFGETKIVPNRKKAADSLHAVRTKLKSALSALESELALIEKRSAEW